MAVKDRKCDIFTPPRVGGRVDFIWRVFPSTPGEGTGLMTQVLIVGASKGIGFACVERALEVGHDVRALARSAHGMEIRRDRLEKVSADARDPAAITEALEDVDAQRQDHSVDVRQRLACVQPPVLLRQSPEFSGFAAPHQLGLGDVPAG